MQFSFCANSYSLKLHEPYATSDVSLFEFVMREKQFLYISYTYVLTLFVLMTRPKIPVHFMVMKRDTRIVFTYTVAISKDRN